MITKQGDNDAGDEGMRLLLAAQHLTVFRVLNIGKFTCNLGSNNISAMGMATIPASKMN